MISIFDLLLRYATQKRIRIDASRHQELTTYHDSCNYGRRSLKAFGRGYFEEARRLVRMCAPNFVEMIPNAEEGYCCGAGGGVWSTPFNEERVYHGRIKARQIRRSGARLVVTSCHNCRDQILKSLCREYDLEVQVKNLWELVADSLIPP